MNSLAPEELRAAAAALMLAGPLIGAGAAIVISSHRLAWLIASVIALLVAGASVILIAGGGIVAAPFGVRVDSIVSVLAPIFGLSGAACVIASGWLAEGDAGKRAAPAALALTQIAWFGWMGAAFAGDTLTAFLLIQIGWLATCGVTALGAKRDRAALHAATRQLSIGAAAGLAFAIGAALVQGATGAIDFADIAAAEVVETRMRAAGFALMIGAAACWAMAAPFHGWAVHSIERGSRLAAMMIASVGAMSALAVLARLALAAEVSDEMLSRGVSIALAALGALSIAIGSIQAVGAQDLRRLAAYAGSAQTGAVLLALAIGTPAGHAGAYMHMAASALIALGLLGGAALIEGRASFDAITGFGRRAPFGGAAIAIGALGLIGAPLTLGFLSRWRLIEATLGALWWWAAGVLIAAALAAVFYAGRLLERLYAHPAAIPAGRPPWRISLTPAHALASFGAIALGFNATDLWNAASLAGELLGGAMR